MDGDNDNFIEMKKEISEIKNDIRVMKETFGIFLRTNMTNKSDLLESAVISNKKLERPQAETLLGCTKQHTLTLMRKLAKKPYFKFYNGDGHTHNPARIIYLEKEKLMDDIYKVGNFVSMTNENVSIARIAEYLGLNLSIHLDYIKEIMSNLVNEYKGLFELVKENGIRYTQKVTDSKEEVV